MPSETPSSPKSVWLERLADAALQRLSGPAVFGRGQTYASSGAIEELAPLARTRDRQAGLSAVIHGTHPYQVSLWFDARDELDGACDCPHAQDGNFCKHLVALALVLRGDLGGSAPVRNPEAERKVAAVAKRARTQAERRDALRRFVQGQSAEALAERLWAWAERDRDCMADLKSWAAVSGAADDPKALRSAITDLLRDRREFLDWRESGLYAARGRAVLDLLRPCLQRDAAAARALAEHALRCLYKVAEHADDSNGELGGLVQDAMDLLCEALRLAPPPASWVDDWFALMDADPWGLWHESAVLDVAGPAVQARYAERVRHDWLAWQKQHPPGGKRARTDDAVFDSTRYRLRRRYIDSVARRNDPQALLEALSGSASTALEFVEVTKLCDGMGRHREALQWAQAAVKRFPRDLRCEDILLQYYERDGWDEEALAIRRRRLEQYPSPAAYQAVLAAARRAGMDAAGYRQQLFAWAEQREKRAGTPNVAVRVRWLLAEGDWQAALDLAQRPGTLCDADVLESLASRLPRAQAAEGARLLQRVFDAVMPGASSPYTRPLALVRDICARLPAAQQAQWLAHLRVQYKAKRNFIAGLP